MPTPTQTWADTPNDPSPIITRGYPYPTRIITRGYGFVARPAPVERLRVRHGGSRGRLAGRPFPTLQPWQPPSEKPHTVIYRVAAQLLMVNDLDVSYLDITGEVTKVFPCADGNIYVVDVKDMDVLPRGRKIEVISTGAEVVDRYVHSDDMTVEAVLKKIRRKK